MTALQSQSAFVRGFIDDEDVMYRRAANALSLNPRSCAASSMTQGMNLTTKYLLEVSIRVRARLHR